MNFKARRVRWLKNEIEAFYVCNVRRRDRRLAQVLRVFGHKWFAQPLIMELNQTEAHKPSVETNTLLMTKEHIMRKNKMGHNTTSAIGMVFGWAAWVSLPQKNLAEPYWVEELMSRIESSGALISEWWNVSSTPQPTEGTLSRREREALTVAIDTEADRIARGEVTHLSLFGQELDGLLQSYHFSLDQLRTPESMANAYRLVEEIKNRNPTIRWLGLFTSPTQAARLSMWERPSPRRRSGLTEADVRRLTEDNAVAVVNEAQNDEYQALLETLQAEASPRRFSHQDARAIISQVTTVTHALNTSAAHTLAIEPSVLEPEQRDVAPRTEAEVMEPERIETEESRAVHLKNKGASGKLSSKQHQLKDTHTPGIHEKHIMPKTSGKETKKPVRMDPDLEIVSALEGELEQAFILLRQLGTAASEQKFKQYDNKRKELSDLLTRIKGTLRENKPLLETREALTGNQFAVFQDKMMRMRENMSSLASQVNPLRAAFDAQKRAASSTSPKISVQTMTREKVHAIVVAADVTARHMAVEQQMALVFGAETRALDAGVRPLEIEPAAGDEHRVLMRGFEALTAQGHARGAALALQTPMRVLVQALAEDIERIDSGEATQLSVVYQDASGWAQVIHLDLRMLLSGAAVDMQTEMFMQRLHAGSTGVMAAMATSPVQAAGLQLLASSGNFAQLPPARLQEVTRGLRLLGNSAVAIEGQLVSFLGGTERRELSQKLERTAQQFTPSRNMPRLDRIPERILHVLTTLTLSSNALANPAQRTALLRDAPTSTSSGRLSLNAPPVRMAIEPTQPSVLPPMDRTIQASPGSSTKRFFEAFSGVGHGIIPNKENVQPFTPSVSGFTKSILRNPTVRATRPMVRDDVSVVVPKKGTVSIDDMSLAPRPPVDRVDPSVSPVVNENITDGGVGGGAKPPAPLPPKEKVKTQAEINQGLIDEEMMKFYAIVGEMDNLSGGKGFLKHHDAAIDTLVDSLKNSAQTFWKAPSDKSFLVFNTNCRAAIATAEKGLENNPGIWRNFLNSLIKALDMIMKFIHIREKDYQPGLFVSPAETAWKDSKIKEKLVDYGLKNGPDSYLDDGVLGNIERTPKPTGR